MAKVLPRQAIREVSCAGQGAGYLSDGGATDCGTITGNDVAQSFVDGGQGGKVLADVIRMEVLVEAVVSDVVALVVVVDTLVVVGPIPLDMVVEALQRTTEPIRVTKAAYGTAMERL